MESKRHLMQALLDGEELVLCGKCIKWGPNTSVYGLPIVVTEGIFDKDYPGHHETIDIFFDNYKDVEIKA